jgi:hypothetical protein
VLPGYDDPMHARSVLLTKPLPEYQRGKRPWVTPHATTAPALPQKRSKGRAVRGERGPTDVGREDSTEERRPSQDRPPAELFLQPFL